MANEPDFVTPWVYAYTDQPWKTDDVLARIEQQTFSTHPDGIPGNDDLGCRLGDSAGRSFVADVGKLLLARV